MDLAWLSSLFPLTTSAPYEEWLSTLKDNEFETFDDLSVLDSAGWECLALPLEVKETIKRFVLDRANSMATATTSPVADESEDTSLFEPEIRPITQIDCIVIDISGSMRSSSNVDHQKTREDVSKMLFHTLIDKIISLELSHAVGLLAFGETIIPIGITTEYERFHDELGRLDASQGRTKLYDGIYSAAEMIEEYVSVHIDPGSNEELRKRIFVLTDGEDNSSRRKPWEVAQFLQQKSIVLDAIPLAGQNNTLQSMCTASRGLCFDVISQEQGINLFEREATLHLAYREVAAEVPPIITGEASLNGIRANKSAPVLEMQSVVSKTVFAPVMTAAEVAKVVSNVTSSSSGTTTSMPSNTRRILKEYTEISKSPVEGWRVFISADNTSSWKAVLSGLPSPYTGGTWLLTIDFPRSYPLQPPKIRFVTPIYHCNISVDGAICLDILQHTWSPALNISSALAAITQLLIEPDAMNPLDAFKGAMYRDYIMQGMPKYLEEATAATLSKAGESFDSLAIKYNLE